MDNQSQAARYKLVIYAVRPMLVGSSVVRTLLRQTEGFWLDQ